MKQIPGNLIQFPGMALRCLHQYTVHHPCKLSCRLIFVSLHDILQVTKMPPSASHDIQDAAMAYGRQENRHSGKEDIRIFSTEK